MRWLYMRYEGEFQYVSSDGLFSYSVLFRLIPGPVALIQSKVVISERIYRVDRLGGRFVCHAGEAKGTFVQN